MFTTYCWMTKSRFIYSFYLSLIFQFDNGDDFKIDIWGFWDDFGLDLYLRFSIFLGMCFPVLSPLSSCSSLSIFIWSLAGFCALFPRLLNGGCSSWTCVSVGWGWVWGQGSVWGKPLLLPWIFLPRGRRQRCFFWPCVLCSGGRWGLGGSSAHLLRPILLFQTRAPCFCSPGESSVLRLGSKVAAVLFQSLRLSFYCPWQLTCGRPVQFQVLRYWRKNLICCNLFLFWGWW